MYMFSSDRERKMAKNRGICAAHTCIPQYREYPPGRHPQVLLEDTVHLISVVLLSWPSSNVDSGTLLLWTITLRRLSSLSFSTTM